MRILFVSSGTSKDGISPLVLNQGESLKAQGINIEYFTINSKGFIGYFCHIFKLRKHLRKNSYDIIHAHYGLSGLVAVLSKQKKQKLIISFMGTDLLGNRTRNGKIKISGNLLVIVSQKLVKYADHIIVKSKEMVQKISCNNVSVIPNGVNLTEFYQIDKSVAIEKLGWDKGSKHIFFMADPKRPEKNFTLARAAFKKLMTEGIEIHILENIPTSRVVYYYNASDVCVLTSFHEGSPNAIKEAMACNCPIVSTGVGDVSEIFGNTDGCYISSFSQDDLTLKIFKALKFSRENGHTVGRNRIIELGLGSETVAQRIVKVYEKVIED
jgi:glycosyltransferase involved in cell wall biosynthesis